MDSIEFAGVLPPLSILSYAVLRALISEFTKRGEVDKTTEIFEEITRRQSND